MTFRNKIFKRGTFERCKRWRVSDSGRNAFENFGTITSK
jgi:hypothetical protein